MEIKDFQITGLETTFPVRAIRATELDDAVITRMVMLDGYQVQYVPSGWTDLVLQESHQYIIDNWPLLLSGQTLTFDV